MIQYSKSDTHGKEKKSTEKISQFYGSVKENGYSKYSDLIKCLYCYFLNLKGDTTTSNWKINSALILEITHVGK